MIARFLPSEARAIVEGTLIALNRSSTSAGIFGIAALLYTGSSVFSVLTQAVDVIWRSHSQPSSSISLKQGVATFVINKIVGAALVFSVAILLLFSMAARVFVSGLLELVKMFQEPLSWIDVNYFEVLKGLQIGASFLVLAIAILILFKILPSSRVAWRDIWLGAVLTAGLIVVLQRLVTSSVVSVGSRYSSYGVIGGIMILMLWIFFTCQIFFIGCELSCVFAYLFGSRRNQPLEELPHTLM
jgi:membrane protein